MPSRPAAPECTATIRVRTGQTAFSSLTKPSQIPLVNGRNTRTFGILNLAPRPYHEQADDIKIMVTLPRLPWHGSLCLTR